MARILAVDPGTHQSGFVDMDASRLYEFSKLDNDKLLTRIHSGDFDACDECVIEMVGHYGTGMSVGKEVFRTCILIGRLAQAWSRRKGREARWLLRKTICGVLCASGRANDSNIRQAIIDRYDGQRAALGAIKCPKCKGKGWFGVGRRPCPQCDGSKWEVPPGPLYGVSGDIWSALAVGLTFFDLSQPGIAVERTPPCF